MAPDAEKAVEMEQISPELVLVDPELRARIAQLPSGPVFFARAIVRVEDPEPAPPARPLFGRVVATGAVILVFLALPIFAIASDLVRRPPRLAPVAPSDSGSVQVGAQQKVFSHPLSPQVRKLDRAR